MNIDFNETEIRAMEAFARGDGKEGTKLQNRFLEELQQSMERGEDHCSCKANCSPCISCISRINKLKAITAMV